jgi:hypothetical protein
MLGREARVSAFNLDEELLAPPKRIEVERSPASRRSPHHETFITEPGRHMKLGRKAPPIRRTLPRHANTYWENLRAQNKLRSTPPPISHHPAVWPRATSTTPPRMAAAGPVPALKDIGNPVTTSSPPPSA